MKKLWTTILGLLLMAGFFSYGCGGSGYDEEASSKASSSEDSVDEYYEDDSDDFFEEEEEEAEPEGAADWIVEAVEGKDGEDDEE